MKRENIFTMMWRILRIAIQYARNHAESIAALDAVYIKIWPRQNMQEEVTSILSISRYGSIYKVHCKSCYYDQPIKDETFMATYGWQSSGHLIEIGGDRYVIFNPRHKALYLEDCSDPRITKLDTYQQI